MQLHPLVIHEHIRVTTNSAKNGFGRRRHSKAVLAACFLAGFALVYFFARSL